MISGVYPTTAAGTGNLYDYFLKSLEAGKIPLEKLERKIKMKFEGERKKVQPIYNAQEGLVEYTDSGRHLNLLA